MLSKEFKALESLVGDDPAHEMVEVMAAGIAADLAVLKRTKVGYYPYGLRESTLNALLVLEGYGIGATLHSPKNGSGVFLTLHAAK